MAECGGWVTLGDSSPKPPEKVVSKVIGKKRVGVIEPGMGGLATRTGFEPVISALTGQYVSRYTTGPRGSMYRV